MGRRWILVAGEVAALAGVLVFVFAVAYLPHMRTFDQPPNDTSPGVLRLGQAYVEAATGDRDTYPYPIHVDEHLHWVFMTSIQRQETVFHGYPYNGDPVNRDAFFSLRGGVHERGFQVAIGAIQEVTGIPFPVLLEFLPASWLTFTAFGVYAALRPHAAALPAAAFVALTPTTLRFMGPGFLVPIGFALAWLPAALIMAELARRRFSASVLAILVIVWAFFIHLIAGFAATGLVLLSAMFGGWRERRSILLLLLVALVPLLWMYNAFNTDVQSELEREESLPLDFTVFDNIGLVGLFVWAAGIAWFALMPPKTNRGPAAALVYGSAAMFALIVVGSAWDLGKYATYARWHPPFFVAAAVPLGYLVASLGQGVRRALCEGPWAQMRWPKTGLALGAAITVVATGALASPGVDVHVDEPYYRVMDEGTWQRMMYVRDNVGPEYDVFLMHPWQSPFLTALTGKYPHTVLLPGTPPGNEADYIEFSRTGGTLEFFVKNDITLVLSTLKPPIPEFLPTQMDGVWVMHPAIANEIHEIRELERAAERR